MACAVRIVAIGDSETKLWMHFQSRSGLLVALNVYLRAGFARPSAFSPTRTFQHPEGGSFGRDLIDTLKNHARVLGE